MKKSDATRCGKASEVMIGRIQAAIEKLNLREAAVMKALESLPAINEALEAAFTKWRDLNEELDEQGELLSFIPEPPSFDVDSLSEEIQAAFLSARESLETDIETYEEIVKNAEDYEEPEEDEEEEDEEVVFTCDHAGCQEETDLTVPEARKAGWVIQIVPHQDEVESFCPKHRP
jgi:hypothetical protein